MSDPPKLSLIAQFDDFARCVWGLVDSDVTEHYIETARTFETICGRAAEVENECQRLQRELNEAMHTISGLESKLTHARRMHDAERRGRVRAEQEIEKLVSLSQKSFSIYHYGLKSLIFVIYRTVI